jgi:hypothetical protein
MVIIMTASRYTSDFLIFVFHSGIPAKSAWPVGYQSLSFPQTIPTWKFLLALIFNSYSQRHFLSVKKKTPVAPCRMVWFIICLLPSSGIIQSGLWPAYANRFMYLPIIGILILYIWELDERMKGIMPM